MVRNWKLIEWIVHESWGRGQGCKATPRLSGRPLGFAIHRSGEGIGYRMGLAGVVVCVVQAPCGQSENWS